VKKHFQFKKFERDLPFIKETIKLSIPFFLGSISAYFYGDMNIVLLEHFTDKTTVAYFSTPYKLITYVYLLFNVVAISFFKKFVEVRNDKVQFLSRVKKA
jgi:O-antigen/teichoic acid export membrane protein